jgi:APA family basic amino acid/polyamine antiporter
LPVIAGHSIAFNLPALLIVAAVTVILVYGIRESAHTNTTIVIIKVAVVVFVIAFGAFMVNPTNWHPFMPHGFPGLMSGAAIVFFALSASTPCRPQLKKPAIRNVTCRSGLLPV